MKLDLTTGGNWPIEELGADALDNISQQVRTEYVDLMTSLGKDRRGDIDWWVTSLASRNTYVCPLYFKLCQLALVKSILEEGKPLSEVVVDSSALSNVLLKMYGGSVNLRVVGKKSRLLWAIKFWRRYFGAVYHAISQYVCSVLWFKKRALPINGKGVLIDVFFTPENIVNSTFADRYYPNMLELLNKKDRENYFYTPIHYGVRSYRRYFQKLNDCNDLFVLKEGILTISDYIFALLHPLRLRWPNTNQYFMGVEIKELVKESLRETFSNSSSVEGLLRYRFVRRLSKIGFKPRKVIEWFENQEVDHGAVAGWREYFPEVEVVGYQGFLSSHHYMSAFPTQQEQEFSLLPTKLIVIGESMIGPAKEFSPELCVETGPAFRFSSIWNELHFCGDTEKFNVLVALPIHDEESKNIVNILAGAISKIEHFGGVNILIKPHPTWSNSKVNRLLLDSALCYELVESDFEAALAMSDIVISSASSVCVYSIAHGIPCIIIGVPGTLLQNPIHKDIDSRLWRTCYTPENLIDGLRYFRNLGPEGKNKLKTIGHDLRTKMFVPVTRSSVLEFVNCSEA